MSVTYYLVGLHFSEVANCAGRTSTDFPEEWWAYRCISPSQLSQQQVTDSVFVFSAVSAQMM